MINYKDHDKRDFKDFSILKDTSPSDELSKTILNIVQTELNPTHKFVFIKLLFLQAFVGVLTMIFCPQFSLSLTNNHELFHYFHHTYGENICMLICGTIFMGSGAFVASLTLKESEIKLIHQSNFLYNFSISIIALVIFMSFGVQTYLSLSALWLVGAILGAMAIFETTYFFRIKILKN